MSNCDRPSSTSSCPTSTPFLETTILLPCTHRIKESVAKDFLQLASKKKTPTSFSCPICKKSITHGSIDIEMRTIANQSLDNYRDNEPTEMAKKNDRKMAFKNQGGRIL